MGIVAGMLPKPLCLSDLAEKGYLFYDPFVNFTFAALVAAAGVFTCIFSSHQPEGASSLDAVSYESQIANHAYGKRSG